MNLEAVPVATQWARLMDLALPALDHVLPGAAPGRWTLGGGTAIALRIGHRASDDIDIFVPGTALKAFAPHNNPAARAISESFQYPGHYLKFERPEGEIDFLGAPLQTAPGFAIESFRGRPVALETLEEVVVKKIRYRAAQFSMRDVFDLACVAQSLSSLPGILAGECGDALLRLAARLEALQQRGDTGLARHVRATPAWRHMEEGGFAVASAAVERARASSTQP